MRLAQFKLIRLDTSNGKGALQKAREGAEELQCFLNNQPHARVLVVFDMHSNSDTGELEWATGKCASPYNVRHITCSSSKHLMSLRQAPENLVWRRGVQLLQGT